MVRCECRPIDNKYLNLLDVGVNDDEDDEDKQGWAIEQGISPAMLYKICVELDISHYAFDITKKCFLKHVSTNQNYPALLYYAINGHMYYLSDKALCIKLIRSSYKMTTKIKSMIIEEDYETKNIFDGREIFENIRVSELMNYNKCVIVYSKTNLNEEFDEIISRYNYIPEIKNNKYIFTLIKFNHLMKDIILVIDPNDRVNMDYKDVKQLCDDNKIIFTNQSFGAFVVQLKEKFLIQNPFDIYLLKKSVRRF